MVTGNNFIHALIIQRMVNMVIKSFMCENLHNSLYGGGGGGGGGGGNNFIHAFIIQRMKNFQYGY